MKPAIVLFTITFSLTQVFAQEGFPDESFGGQGKVFTQISTNSEFKNDECYDVAVQADGKIVAVGESWNGDSQSEYCIVRYLPDGNIDTGFGENGIVKGDLGYGKYNRAKCVAVVNDKILVGGWGFLNINGTNTAFVLRLNYDGSFDMAFGVNGWKLFNGQFPPFVSMAIEDMAIQADGKIVLAGYQGYFLESENFLVMRLDASGFLDTSFGNGGVSLIEYSDSTGEHATHVEIDANNKILAGGYFKNNTKTLVRYNSDGTLDYTFGENGVLLSDPFDSEHSDMYGMSIAPSGKIFICGGYPYFMKAACYNDSGTLDADFGINGVVTYEMTAGGRDLMVLADNRFLLVAEHFSDWIVVRYLANGSIDSSFGTNGLAEITVDDDNFIYSMALQPDGKIILAGSARKGGNNVFAIARFLSSAISSVEESASSPTNTLNLHLYPNPASTETTLIYTLAGPSRVTISLSDLQGKFIQYYSNAVLQYEGIHTLQIELDPALSPGIYVLTLSSDENQISINIDKQ